MKAQYIRLIDVFLIGPGMIYISREKSLSPIARLFLLTTGAATIVYNGKNYLAYEN